MEYSLINSHTNYSNYFQFEQCVAFDIFHIYFRYFQSIPNTKGFNQLHLNAMYDLCNKLYVDVCIQPGRPEAGRVVSRQPVGCRSCCGCAWSWGCGRCGVSGAMAAPLVRGPAGISAMAMWRMRVASGQDAAKAMRTRAAVSMMRAPSFSRRMRMVANSALTRACVLGRRRGRSASASRRRCAGSGASGWPAASGTRCGPRPAAPCAS